MSRDTKNVFFLQSVAIKEILYLHHTGDTVVIRDLELKKTDFTFEKSELSNLGPVDHLFFTDDDSHLVEIRANGLIRVWSLEKKTCKIAKNDYHILKCFPLCGGKKFYTIDSGARVIEWNTELDHNNIIVVEGRPLCISSKGHQLVSAIQDGALQNTINKNRPTQVRFMLNEHDAVKGSQVTDATYHPASLPGNHNHK